MTELPKSAIGFITSGGDSPGMNPTIRAVVRTAIDRHIPVYAIHEGYSGMCAGEPYYSRMSWDSVGGILQRGGTLIGTARSQEFYHPEGRRRAVANLVRHSIDRLVIIGGDGSLTGAMKLAEEWSDHLHRLIFSGDLPENSIELHPSLQLVGLPGSIDNDLPGTDMSIGADTALMRITEAVDAITSTAASHQRIFIVEVMGRNCGYLALMSALATGADWVLIPEDPPDPNTWVEELTNFLLKAREAGRRQSIIILAEGSRDTANNPITSTALKETLEASTGEEVRITVLGHVQRGGSPSAFDRTLGTRLGYEAVKYLDETHPDAPPVLIGMRGNRIVHTPLIQCLEKKESISLHLASRNYKLALELRGRRFGENLRGFKTVSRVVPHLPETGQARVRLAVMNAGAPAPGMNTAVRTAVRIAIDRGHQVYGVRRGFAGLIAGDIQPLDWNEVAEWSSLGGSMLGTNRKVPVRSDLYGIARNLESLQINGLLMIGGWTGYEAVSHLTAERSNFPAFNIPIVCLPATIDNDLPGSEISIGADTALNNILSALDKIKQSAVASNRCFVVEVMGRSCGYLALLSGLASGAERVYIPEEGVTLKDLQDDLRNLASGFKNGKRLGLLIRNENTTRIYNTAFMAGLFEEESGDLFEVRQAILGHLQQGGDPSPFDRIQATRLATHGVEYLLEEISKDSHNAAYIGTLAGKVELTSFDEYYRQIDSENMRPREEWWMDLRPVVRMLAKSDQTEV